MKFLTVVSQKNQALRLRLFLSDSEAGRRIREKIQLSTLVLYLDWGDSTAPIPDEINELSKTLGDAPIQRVTLPNATQVFTRLRFRDFSTIYEKIVTDNPDLEKAYLMSYEGHYAVMARILNTAGVSLTLIEEGLGTYVHSFDNRRISVPNLGGTLFQAAKGFLGPIINRDPSTSISAIFQRAVREVYWGIFGEPVANKNEITSGFREFKTFHSSFPDLAKKVFPNAKVKFTPFGLVMLRATETGNKSQSVSTLDTKDSLFLGQTYPLSSLQLKAILERALEITPGNIWIKPHPRLTPDGRQVFLEAVSLTGSNRLLFLENNNPAEYDIYQLRPNLVLSLTSSALTYANQVHPACSCISLADLAISLLDASSTRADRRTRTILAADRAVLEFFPHIQIDPGKATT
ncbi:Alpha-2,8-polysialyltransferase [Microbacteriaceae bacterium]